jgi:hypothetical protein
MQTSDAQKKIEAYLGRLRRGLRGLDGEEVHEIVEELRGHIMDRAAAQEPATPASMDAVLAALGDADELAREYMTDRMLARADSSRSPSRVLESLFRWATFSAKGFAVLLSAAAGYFFGTLFILFAMLKPFHPHTAGLWTWRDSTGDLAISLRLGFEGAPAGAREILGWWAVPAGVLAGCGLLLLTTRFALWCIRQYGRARVLPLVSGAIE